MRQVIEEHIPEASGVHVTFLDEKQHRFRVRVFFVTTLANADYEHFGRLGIRVLDNQSFESAIHTIAREIRDTLEGLQ